MAFVKPNTTLSPLLNQWKSLLQQWVLDGSLVTAAQEALLLSGIPEGLQILIDEWAVADFKSLPEVGLLSAADISGAMGAYAISTGKIYLNETWLEGARKEDVFAVLTEELGHHLDGLFNAEDTPGDEGYVFAEEIKGRTKSRELEKVEAKNDDHTIVNENGVAIEAEASNLKLFYRISGKNLSEITAIKIDKQGNIFVLGLFSASAVFGDFAINSNGAKDLFVSSTNSFGEWDSAINYGTEKNEIVYFLEVADNKAFVSYQTSPSRMGTILMFSPEGNPTNVAEFRIDDYSKSLVKAIDTNNILFSGKAFSAYGSTITIGTLQASIKDRVACYVVSKPLSGNDATWIKTFNSPYDTLVQAIDTNPAGDIIVSGYFNRSISSDGLTGSGGYGVNIFVASLAKDGTLKWLKTAGGNSNTSISAIKLLNDGSCYVTGSFSGNAGFGSLTLSEKSGSSSDIYIAKISKNGNFEWARSFGGDGNDGGTVVKTTGKGDVIFGGIYHNTIDFGKPVKQSLGGSDVFIASLSQDGEINWATSAGGENADYLNDITIDDQTGNIRASGTFSGGIFFGSNEILSASSVDIFVGTMDNKGEWAAAADRPKILLNRYEIIENSSLVNPVAEISLSNNEGSGTYTYFLWDGDGQNDNASFRIEGTKLYLKDAPDYESQSTYNVRIAGFGKDESEIENFIQLQIIDQPEPPDSISLSNLIVPENTAIGSSVATIRSHDQDKGDSARYSLAPSNNQNNNSKFSIKDNTLLLEQPLDYETQKTCSVDIIAEDSQGLRLSQKITLNVLDVIGDTPPKESYILKASQTLSANNIAAYLLSNDIDTNDHHNFTLVNGKGDESNKLFKISGNNLLFLGQAEVFDLEIYSIRLQTVDYYGNTIEQIVMLGKEPRGANKEISLKQFHEINSSKDSKPEGASVDINYGLKELDQELRMESTVTASGSKTFDGKSIQLLEFKGEGIAKTRVASPEFELKNEQHLSIRFNSYQGQTNPENQESYYYDPDRSPKRYLEYRFIANAVASTHLQLIDVNTGQVVYILNLDSSINDRSLKVDLATPYAGKFRLEAEASSKASIDYANLVGSYWDKGYVLKGKASASALLGIEGLKITTSTADVNNGQAVFSIKGSPANGQTLTAIEVTKDTDGDPTKFDYQWQSSTDGANWSNIGANAATYTITNAEQAKQIRVQVFYTDAQNFQESLTAAAVTVGAVAPTYTLTPSATTINEGAVLTSTITTTNLATGTKLYYALSGTGITTADFSAGALTGEGTTDATGKSTFTHTLANDLTTEGAESLNIKLFTDSSLSTQVGSTASVSIADTSVNPFNLDIDGDGKVTALGDGLMVIRKLFGFAFAGDVLTNKAISPTATRTTSEIHRFIESGISTGMLDVDKDGKTTALGDGLMVIRHLFGAAFAGEALTNKAISPDSPYFGPPVDHLTIANAIDSMKVIPGLSA